MTDERIKELVSSIVRRLTNGAAIVPHPNIYPSNICNAEQLEQAISGAIREALAEELAENERLKRDLDAAIDVMADHDIPLPEHLKTFGKVVKLQLELAEAVRAAG